MKQRPGPPSRKRLAPGELRKRARRIKLVLSDNDGVMTDTGVYYGESGEMLKRFSIRDGMGVERLRARGIETAIITGETSGSVRSRAAKLNMPYCFLGVRDKRAHLETISRETGVPVEEMAFIGDDVNDLTIIGALNDSGITAAPADAMPEVTSIVHYTCRKPGGHGAFRDFAEWLLRLRRES
jgi:3-deoxy-D-manno-octulosonate 8-phosphate phosphatase (KDO 8-P phosphatase)